jgi:hypothetical protein
MTTHTVLAKNVTAMRADLAAAEQELDRADVLADAAAVVRVRISLEPRIVQLRRAIADAERVRQATREMNGDDAS